MEENKKGNILQERKDYVQKKIEEIKAQINEFEKLDNTNPDVILALLNIKKNNNLLLKSFNILSKEDLFRFGINKKLSNRETYFYFLRYIISIEIKNEENNEKNPEKNDENEKNNESFEKVNNLSIDLSEGKIKVKDNSKEENDDIDYEKDIDTFKKIIKRKNINIEDVFHMNEEITIKRLKNKINKYNKDISYKDEFKNNYASFNTELFFHIQTKNVLNSYDDLNDDNFSKKIYLTKNLYRLIEKVEQNKIKDRFILMYFYFVIDMEYELDLGLIILLDNYDEVNVS